MAKRIERVQVRRIRQRHHHAALGFVNGHDIKTPRHVPGNRGDRVVRNLDLPQHDEFNAQLRGLRCRHLRGGKNALLDQRINYAFPGGISFRASRLDVGRHQQAHIRQRIN